MKLHPVNRKFAMLQSHNFTVIGLGGDNERIRQTIAFYDEGMITGGLERLRHAFKNACAVVRNRGCFPMHQLRGMHNFAAENFADALVTEANAE